MGSKPQRLAVFAALLVVLMVSGARKQLHAAELEDLAGEWAILIHLPDQPQMASLSVVSASDGALVATINTPLGESVIEDIDVIDGQHVMLYMMDLGGQPMDIEVSATVEGDMLAGNVLVGGGAMDLPIEGARIGTAAEAELNARLAELQAASVVAAGAEDAASTEAMTTAAGGAATQADSGGAIEGSGETGTAAEGNGGEGTGAADTAAARLPVDQAQDLLGNWVLKVTTFRGDNYADFKASDEEGFLLAEFALPPPMTVDPIRSISREGEALTMKFILNFGSSVIDMTMKLKPEEGRYVGTLVDSNNMFNSEVVLLTPEQAQEDKAQAAAGDGNGDGDSDDPEANRATTKLTVGEKAVSIDYSETKATGEDYERLATLQPGEVVRYTTDFATKLRTDVALKFPDATIETENVVPNYPGVYSLWLEKGAEGWMLRFNNRPDVWGTQHNPEANGPGVALAHEIRDAEAPALSYSLSENGEGAGRLQIEWGEHAWSADFEFVP